MKITKNSALCVLLNFLLFEFGAVKAHDCFGSNWELRQAVVDYVDDPANPSSAVALRYGWPINEWCVDNIEDFSRVFDGGIEINLRYFNEDISGWNTTSAKNMYKMFYYATSFNQPIGGWDTSRVTTMAWMFYHARAFNQPIAGWNTSRVKTMEYMFGHAWSFNQPLEGWDTSRVTTMYYMFESASSFNQPLEGWDTSSVTTMYGMFYFASSFNGPLEGWNTSRVTTMSNMFNYASSFNQPLEGWDTSRVTTMTFMFSIKRFNQPLAGWNVSSVTRMDGMFYFASSFNQDLCPWGPQLQGRYVYTLQMFYGAGCPSGDSSPNLAASPPGPLCYECLANVTIDLVPFYIALQLPNGGPDDEPSQDDFEQLRLQTERFLEQTFRRMYPMEVTADNTDAGRRELQSLGYVYGSLHLTTFRTNYRGGVPEEDYNIYAGYNGFVIFYGTQPTAEDLFDLIEESNSTEYVSGYVSAIPSFAGVTNATAGADADIISFSPSVSLIPTSAPSPFPTVSLIPTSAPSLFPTAAPSQSQAPTALPSPQPSDPPTNVPTVLSSPQPSNPTSITTAAPSQSQVPTALPSPQPSNPTSNSVSIVPTFATTLQPTEEPCPCGRFRLICRLIWFRLCFP